MLLMIAAAYIVLRAKGYPSGSLTPYISIVGAVALLISSTGKRNSCCARRRQEADAET
jgi:hypothetical protein